MSIFEKYGAVKAFNKDSYRIADKMWDGEIITGSIERVSLLAFFYIPVAVMMLAEMAIRREGFGTVFDELERAEREEREERLK